MTKMNQTENDLGEFRRLLADGSASRGYRALLAFMRSLRTRYATEHSDYRVSALYQGQCDMTFFAISPPSLAKHQLKLAVLFNYELFRFELWLVARNRRVQRRYWELLRLNQWASDYRLVEPAPGVDAILERDVADGAGLVDPETLTASIESYVSGFIGDVDVALREHDSGV